MLKNYIRVALRNLFRNKSFSVINIAGLAVGMAAFLLIALFIQDEWSYDHFHQKAERIYRLSPPAYARTAPLLAPTVKADFPEVESAIRLNRFGGIVKQGELSFSEENLAYASQDILNMFSFNFLHGSASGALTSPNTVIIDEKLALKYFNSTDVVGRKLTFLDTIPLTIKGVYQHWPSNSHLPLNMVVSAPTYENMGFNLETWKNNIYYTYVLLQEKADPTIFKSKIPAFLDQHIRSLPNREDYNLVAQNLLDIHLHSNKDMEWGVNSSITTVYTFAILALIILFIAGINFMNLSTAIATRRAKEIGVRKTIGARFTQLIGQFLSESIIISFISLGFALLMVHGAIPYLNQLADKTLSTSVLCSPLAVAALIGFTILVGLLAGLYPAFVLSALSPLAIFRGKRNSKKQGVGMREALVFTQFALSLFLLVSSIVVYQQVDFMKKQSLGFDKEQVLILPYSWDARVREKYELLKTRFLQNPDVQYVTQSGDIPGRMATQMGYWAEGMPEEEYEGMQALYIDKDFSEVYGLETVSGRTINNEVATDLESGYLLNEQAVASIGWTPEEAIGKRFSVHTDGTVVGVVKDFHFHSLQQAVQPLFLALRPSWSGYISLRVNTAEVEQLIASLEATWTTMLPDRPFSYTFLDEDYNRLYQGEVRLGNIVALFSLLAIFIACIGLFGLTTFTVERRNKEIAVRKVLGASAPHIVLLLSKDFLRPIIGAILVASPLVFWLSRKWLNNFAYQVDLHPGWFVCAALALMALAWFALGFQSFKAAIVSPVKWLKET